MNVLSARDSVEWHVEGNKMIGLFSALVAPGAGAADPSAPSITLFKSVISRR
jgi:hypothetical protein